MNIANFDLNLLRVLDAMLRETSTVKAGRRIGLSQPAVSAALARLRHALGDELFVRRGNRLVATDYARSLAVPLRTILDELERLLSGPTPFDPSTSTATFKLSGSDFFAELLMPRLADIVSRRAPGMRVQLVDLVPDSYVGSLERYEVDMAIIPRADFPDWVDSRPAFWSTFSVVARKGHPVLRRAGVRMGDTMPLDLFCTIGHVLFSPEGRLKAMGDAALARIGRERRVVMSLPVFAGVYRAVAQSDLIALLPTRLAEHAARTTGIRIYRPPVTIAPALMTMVWHKRSSATPEHCWLRDLIAGILLPLSEMPLPAAPGSP